MSSPESPRSFRHHMLREIYEQPAAIARTLDFYLDLTPPVPAHGVDVDHSRNLTKAAVTE